MKKSFVAFWVFLSLCFQSAVFAMPCCYGMATTAAESMVQSMKGSHSSSMQSAHCDTDMASHDMASMGHGMDHEEPASGEHGCPMAGLALSSPATMIQDVSALPPQVGARIMQGKLSTLLLNQHLSRIDRPPRLV